MSVAEVVSAIQQRVGAGRLIPMTMAVSGVTRELGLTEGAARGRLLKAVKDGDLVRIKPDYDRSIVLPGAEDLKVAVYAEGPDRGRVQSDSRLGTYFPVTAKDRENHSYGVGSVTFVATPADCTVLVEAVREMVAAEEAARQEERERRDKEIKEKQAQERVEGWAEVQRRRPNLHRELLRLETYLGEDSDVGAIPIMYHENAVAVHLRVAPRHANKLRRLLRLGLDAIEAEEAAKEKAEQPEA